MKSKRNRNELYQSIWFLNGIITQITTNEKNTFVISIIFFQLNLISQNFNFDFNSSGRRVCLVSSEVDLIYESVRIIFHDSFSNITEPIFENRRFFKTHNWVNIVENLSVDTSHWVDDNATLGETWEY